LASLKEKAKARAKSKATAPKKPSKPLAQVVGQQETFNSKGAPAPGGAYTPPMPAPLPPALGFIRSYAQIPGLRKDKTVGDV
jgi:hypothetical protein